MILPGFPKPIMSAAAGPVFRSVNSYTGTAANVTVTAPAGQVAGDFLIAVFGCQAGGRQPTTPTGWTLGANFNGPSSEFQVYWRVATASGESVDMNTAGTGNRSIIYAAYIGATAIDFGTISSNTSGSASITITAVTATAPGTRLVACFNDIQSGTLTSPPSGFTQIILLDGGVLNLGLWDFPGSPAGSSGTTSITWSTTDHKAGVLMQIY